jgi:hypothetical protein
MKLPDTNLVGIYSRYDHPDDGGSWVNNDVIFIYQDESQRLAYNFLFEEEDNYSQSYVFEEGFVYLEAEGRELHFEHLRRYEYAGGGGMGYDISGYHSVTYQPRQIIQIFHIYYEAEITDSSLAARIVYEETKVVLLDKKEDSLYERVDDGEHLWYQSAEGLETIIVNTREELHKHWQDRIKNYVRTKLAQGIPPDEIAARCDWTVSSIRAFQKQQTKGSAKKK